MADHILPGAPPVPLVLRRSGRARRISLRISQLDGRVTLTLPNGVADVEALEFANSKGEWIRDHLKARRDDVAVLAGATLPVEGVTCRIVQGASRRVIVQPGEILVPEGQVGPRLKAWLRTLARERLVEACDHYAGGLGRSYARITLRDTRSRWGSCSSQGALMFSWRLILARPEVLRYVAAHEVAHLAEMNHSAAFWGNVQNLYGDYADARRWLRKNGAALHRYRFDG
jgi:predicted metal-dependent hydrolase